MSIVAQAVGPSSVGALDAAGCRPRPDRRGSRSAVDGVNVPGKASPRARETVVSLTERLAACYTGAIHDAMRAMGFERFTLPSEIRPILPERRLAGRVWTVSGRVDPTADPHATLLAWTGLLSKAPRDHVIVCQANDSTVAHMGELSAETLQLRGVRGYVVDGGCRDVEFLLPMGFPVFCRYFTPRDIVGHWLAEGLGEPVTIGEVRIHTGDYLLGDRDGVVVIPAADAEAIVARTEETVATENEMRTAIIGGMDPQDAYRKWGKF
jgi:4-hydroxy-4-methyl-2-oxoglutarate aldolase